MTGEKGRKRDAFDRQPWNKGDCEGTRRPFQTHAYSSLTRYCNAGILPNLSLPRPFSRHAITSGGEFRPPDSLKRMSYPLTYAPAIQLVVNNLPFPNLPPKHHRVQSKCDPPCLPTRAPFFAKSHLRDNRPRRTNGLPDSSPVIPSRFPSAPTRLSRRKPCTLKEACITAILATPTSSPTPFPPYHLASRGALTLRLPKYDVVTGSHLRCIDPRHTNP